MPLSLNMFLMQLSTVFRGLSSWICVVRGAWKVDVSTSTCNLFLTVSKGNTMHLDVPPAIPPHTAVTVAFHNLLKSKPGTTFLEVFCCSITSFLFKDFSYCLSWSYIEKLKPAWMATPVTEAGRPANSPANRTKNGGVIDRELWNEWNRWNKLRLVIRG